MHYVLCYNDMNSQTFSLLALSLLGQLLKVNLGSQTTVGSDGLVVARQLFKSLEVLISEGVGTDRTERSGRSSAGSEELEHASASLYPKIPDIPPLTIDLPSWQR